MGTRAQFFIGNPQDVESRQWLGTIAWDGYPDGDCGALKDAKTEGDFRSFVTKLAGERKDFCDPVSHDFRSRGGTTCSSRTGPMRFSMGACRRLASPMAGST